MSLPIGDIARLLVETLRAQRTRSLLTILGISIGIASVVLLSSIGEGTRQGIAGQFNQFGTTLVSVLPGKNQTFGRGPGYMGGTTHKLTMDDVWRLKRIRGVRWIAPNVSGVGELKIERRSRYTYVYGVLAEGQNVWQWRPRIGTFIPEGDPDLIPPVCVLGAKNAAELFPGENPLGRRVRVGETRFTVVGVMASKGLMVGFDLDDAVYIPIRRAMRLFNRDQVAEVHMYVGSHSMIPRVMEEAERLLQERHGGEKDFTILQNSDMLELVDEVMNVLTAGVVVIAGVSVLVGAMGILTIMWVAVRERTSEIGLLKAVGASNRQVLGVFLAEAAALSALGGAVGLAVGFGTGHLLGLLAPGLWIQTPPVIVPLSLGVSVGVGLLAGIAPALRAAALDPVVALRAE